MRLIACPFASWNDFAVVEPSQHPAATTRHYKWRRSAPSLHTPFTPLLSLSLLHRSISPDLAGAAPIASSHPPELADHRHRLEQPRASSRYQGLLHPRQPRLDPRPRPPATSSALRPPTSPAQHALLPRRRRRRSTVDRPPNPTALLRRYRFGSY
jgi:hypothetical protein